jgi:hypothetical protein
MFCEELKCSGMPEKGTKTIASSRKSGSSYLKELKKKRRRHASALTKQQTGFPKRYLLKSFISQDRRHQVRQLLVS